MRRPRKCARILCWYGSGKPYMVTVLDVRDRVHGIGKTAKVDGWIAVVQIERHVCRTCGMAVRRTERVSLGMEWFDAKYQRAERARP